MRRPAQGPRGQAETAGDLHRPHGVRHQFAACYLGKGRLYGHIKRRKHRTRFLEFRRHLRSLHPPQTRIAIVRDNSSPHLSTKKDARVGDWTEGRTASNSPAHPPTAPG